VATSDHKPVRAVYEVPSVVSPPQVVTDQLDSEILPLRVLLLFESAFAF
jgi:hypothetical protein